MEVKLRVILLIVGLVILFVVGLDLFRRKKTALDLVNMVDINGYKEPAFADVEPRLEPASVPEPAVELKPIPHNIISITLRARDPYGFKGSALLNAAQSAHLHFGKHNIFYRHIDDNAAGEILFSLVKAVEPGYFYIESLADEYVTGVTLILLPEQIDNPHLAFDKLVRTAKQMAFTLNAELLDHVRKPLTLETIDRYSKQAKQK